MFPVGPRSLSFTPSPFANITVSDIPSRAHLSVMSLEALDKLSSNIAELARLFACKLPVTGPPHNWADGFNQTSELTEVAGKDRERRLPRALPPRLLEKYAGAGRPNGQPRPVDNTDSPLLTPGFSSVSFTPKPTRREMVHASTRPSPATPLSRSLLTSLTRGAAGSCNGYRTSSTGDSLGCSAARSQRTKDACMSMLSPRARGQWTGTAAVVRVAGHWSREPANRHAGSNHPAVVERRDTPVLLPTTDE
jgi:hypothetical protein